MAGLLNMPLQGPHLGNQTIGQPNAVQLPAQQQATPTPMPSNNQPNNVQPQGPQLKAPPSPPPAAPSGLFGANGFAPAAGSPDSNSQLAFYQAQQQAAQQEHAQLQSTMIGYLSSDKGQEFIKNISGEFPVFSGLMMNSKEQQQGQQMAEQVTHNQPGTQYSQTVQQQIDNMPHQPITPASEAMYKAKLAATPYPGASPVNSPALDAYQTQSSPISGFQEPF